MLVLSCTLVWYTMGYSQGICKIDQPDPSFSGAWIYADPKAGPSPLEVIFTGEGRKLKGPFQFRWDFGDGNVSHNPTPVHVYDRGIFIVILALMDSNGEKYSASVTIDTLHCTG